MPFVRIDLFERAHSREQKESPSKEVTEAVVRNTGAPQSAVHVVPTICLKEPGYKVKCALSKA